MSLVGEGRLAPSMEAAVRLYVENQAEQLIAATCTQVSGGALALGVDTAVCVHCRSCRLLGVAGRPGVALEHLHVKLAAATCVVSFHLLLWLAVGMPCERTLHYMPLPLCHWLLLQQLPCNPGLGRKSSFV